MRKITVYLGVHMEAKAFRLLFPLMCHHEEVLHLFSYDQCSEDLKYSIRFPF